MNVLWGFTNFVLAYLLLVLVGRFDLRSSSCILPFAIGALLISLQLAKHLGEFTEATPRRTSAPDATRGTGLNRAHALDALPCDRRRPGPNGRLTILGHWFSNCPLIVRSRRLH